MGGINPEKPTLTEAGGDLSQTQQHCRGLFLSSSQFFAAQAALEDAVIAETEGQPGDHTAVARARELILAASDTLQGAVHHLEENRATLLEGPGSSWHASYFSRQLESLRDLSALAKDLTDAIAAPMLDDAVAERSLQRSFWHEEANHRVRTLGVAYLEVLLAALQQHITVVVETNEPE